MKPRLNIIDSDLEQAVQFNVSLILRGDDMADNGNSVVVWLLNLSR